MFLKVVKNNFINSWKDYGFVYALGTGLCFLLFIAIETNFAENSEVLALLFFFMVFGLIISIAVLSIRATLKLLYSSLYTIDPVLTWTQPVSSTVVLGAKMLTALAWNVISFVFMYGIGYILLSYIFTKSGTSMDTVLSLMSMIIQMDGGVLSVLIFSNIVDSLFYITILLLAGAIANSSYFRSKRAALTALFYFVLLYGVTQIVQIVAPNSPIIFNTGNNALLDINTLIFSLNESLGYVIGYYSIYLVFTILFFYLATRIIDKKLEV